MKNVLITGAAGNLGQAVCKTLLESNYNLWATLGPGESPDFMIHPKLKAEPVNLLDEDSVNAYVNKVTKDAGSIDLLILLVGGFAMGNIEQTGSSQIDKMFQLNFKTAYHCVHAALPLMEKQSSGGQVVMVGARPAIQADAGKHMVAYALSKSLIFNLSEVINSEYEAKKIHSSVIVPSIIDTPVNREAMPDSDFSKWVTPQEIATNIAFLDSDAGKKLRRSVLKIYGES